MDNCLNRTRRIFRAYTQNEKNQFVNLSAVFDAE